MVCVLLTVCRLSMLTCRPTPLQRVTGTAVVCKMLMHLDVYHRWGEGRALYLIHQCYWRVYMCKCGRGVMWLLWYHPHVNTMWLLYDCHVTIRWLSCDTVSWRSTFLLPGAWDSPRHHQLHCWCAQHGVERSRRQPCTFVSTLFQP